MRPGTGLRPLRGALVALLAIACGAGSLPVAAPATAAETSEARARRVIDGFVAGHMARHPEEASALGDHARDDALPRLTAPARSGDEAWYRAQRESLAAVAATPLPPALAVDARLLLGRATREARLREGAPGPGWWLDPLHLAITESLRGFHASPCVRAATLRHRLRAVPEYLRDARIALGHPDRVAIEHALERVDLLLHRLRVELPAAFESCREARLQADLAESDSLATGALEEFADHLRETLRPAAANDVTTRPERLRSQLEETAGGPVALDSLAARLREEWSKLAPVDADTEPVAGPIDADSADVLFERLVRELVRAGEIADRGAERIEPRARSPLRAMERVTSLGPWDGRGARARLELGPRLAGDEEWAGGAADADPLRSRAGARFALAGEGVPGRAWFVTAEVRLGSRARQAFGLESIRDGWSRYAETVWLDTRSGAEREFVAGAIARLERGRLARAMAELTVALETDGVERAARWLETTAGMNASAARRAALEAAESPRWTAAALAGDRFRALRAEAARRLGDRFDPVAFHAAVLREGAVPTAWVAETILAASAGKPRTRR